MARDLRMYRVGGVFFSQWSVPWDSASWVAVCRGTTRPVVTARPLRRAPRHPGQGLGITAALSFVTGR